MKLQKILIFVTGIDEEPVLGFEMHPSILFIENTDRFLPTSMTCINQLKLPCGSMSHTLPSDKELFALYDYSFLNSHFGLM